MSISLEKVRDPDLRLYIRAYCFERRWIYDLLSGLKDSDLCIRVHTPFGGADIGSILTYILCYNARAIEAITTSEFEEPPFDLGCEFHSVKPVLRRFKDSEKKIISACTEYKGASITHYITLQGQKVTIIELLITMLVRESILFGCIYSALGSRSTSLP
jgi:hypothetical protein